MIREAPAARQCLSLRQQRLVEANLGLAYLYSRRWSTPRITTDELVGAACEALCRAALRWEPRRGSFARYASVAMCHAVQREARLLTTVVSVSRTASRQVLLCVYRYDPSVIPPREELSVILNKSRLGARQYQYFRQAWLALRPRRSLQEVL